MTKIDIMDKYLSSLDEKINTSEICKVVYKVFGIDLDTVSMLHTRNTESTNNNDTSNTSQSRTTIDMYLNHYGKKITGVEIRSMLNQIFGINLNAIAELEKERISLYSKGQWVVQNDKDLFIVYTGMDDVDVKVLPTEYFTNKTGLDVLPSELQRLLSSYGYYYDERIQSYYFANPTGEAVSDDFKGQTIAGIVKVIRKFYSHL